MYLTNNLKTNEKGHLEIGSADTFELANQYGTPLYVMDEQLIRQNAKQFKESVEKYYGKGLVCYASKAFSCKEIYRIMQSEGLGVDVVSAGELFTAMSVGFDAKNICLHGNNKTKQELEYAIECGVGRIVVDNLTELELVDKLAGEAGKKVNIMFRIKPGIDAHTHEFVQTGQIDSKFGFALETGEALEVSLFALKKTNVELVGLHCHIGSQIFDIAPFELAAKVMLELIAEIKKQSGCELKELNLGGGFGIKYTKNDTPKQYDTFMEKVSTVVKETCKKLGLELPFVILEPGRSIVGPAGITLYTIGNIKNIPNVRTYVSIDGGMTDNPRYALYRSEYSIVLANKAAMPSDKKVTIAGKCCESGDLIGENMMLADAEVGDTLAVLATGAYNYSMSSNYNRNPRPAVVMVNDGKSRIIVKRETLEDIVRNDI